MMLVINYWAGCYIGYGGKYFDLLSVSLKGRDVQKVPEVPKGFKV